MELSRAIAFHRAVLFDLRIIALQAPSGNGSGCGNIRCMNEFPEFMKNPANRIARSNQATPGVEGYVFDGADESQMAFWTCTQTAQLPQSTSMNLMSTCWLCRVATQC